MTPGADGRLLSCTMFGGTMAEVGELEVSWLTCSACARRQRVSVRHVGEAVVIPLCSSCGPTTWLDLPVLDAAPYPPEPGPMQQWIDWIYGWSDVDPSGWHDGA
jgi:hypothetical protein